MKDLLVTARVFFRTSNVKISVFIWQTTSKYSTKKLASSAVLLFFIIQAIKSLICGQVAVAVAVVVLLESFSNGDGDGKKNVT